jgi:hypothetical protein
MGRRRILVMLKDQDINQFKEKYGNVEKLPKHISLS